MGTHFDINKVHDLKKKKCDHKDNIRNSAPTWKLWLSISTLIRSFWRGLFWPNGLDLILGFLKLNTEGASQGNSSIGGGGGVIRDEDGKFGSFLSTLLCSRLQYGGWNESEGDGVKHCKNMQINKVTQVFVDFVVKLKLTNLHRGYLLVIWD